ncbi:glycosyltransferase [Streptomyces aurantiacus]|uniref:Putative Sterol 3-beta-glucosyltransferase n=1 Tax=Streptomyces aurantiacus JA 4570 TaxID=1286094 RepID=S3ZMK9_9ACTN|nr:glycosyltransferase [Streptomyces aurantiacus]EPH39580.1 putative Sterol 3-beta-glucosyltransferase [Streptomyces aurantiacus JA 4570]
MRILIAAAGSYGDIAPYTGLGTRLRMAGHDVAIATHDGFAPLVRDAGLRVRPLPADAGAPGPGAGRRALMRTASAFVRDLGAGLADAFEEGDDLLVLSTTTAPLGWQLAEALDVPTIGAYLQPVHPTREFAPVVSGARSLGGWGNRAMGRFSLRMVDRVYADAVRDLRSRLGLPAAAPAAVRARREGGAWPVLHGFSPAVVRRPADWRAGLDVVGNWWPHHDPAARLPPDVEDFLGSGPPPVFIGFGSMAAGEGERLGELAVAALRRAGLRGVLQSGRAGLAAAGDGILTVGELPHALLFPRMAAVVHHAGAGTAAAGLRAGVPAVPVPVTADQPFWAARLTALGAAPAPVPFRTLTAERLAEALTRAVHETTCATAAAAVSRAMAAEDGAGEFLKAVERLGLD